MFNRTVVNYTDTSQLASAVNRASAESNRVQSENIEKLVRSKDRVDISLKEYIDLKNRVERAENKVREDNKIFKQLRFPVDSMRILPETVKCYTNDNPQHCGFRRSYQIMFDVDMFPEC